jgi:hypothetical protein
MESEKKERPRRLSPRQSHTRGCLGRRKEYRRWHYHNQRKFSAVMDDKTSCQRGACQQLEPPPAIRTLLKHQCEFKLTRYSFGTNIDTTQSVQMIGP